MKKGWKFDNSYMELPQKFYSKTNPTPVPNPELIVINQSLARELGLNVEELMKDDHVKVLGGNQIPDGANPIAQAYAGHQFGQFTMLGDGRAVLLGEQIAPNGDRYDVQLKGSGRTPYSRGGDGRAALGPMLREYIISEAMHALGIPTTRSLAVVTTGEEIYRERDKTGAILTRIAASHIRVGTFQYAANFGTIEDLRALADYTLKRHFNRSSTQDNPYLFLLKEVIRRQAQLIAKWQLVGFIHGVMNTDNMAISGETIDYGPCAFMNEYDPATVFSSIDQHGRYAYHNQPKIGTWNLARFAETLLPLLHGDEEKAVKIAQAEIARFSDIYFNEYLAGMRKKLGLFNVETEDEKLIVDLLGLMQKYQADYTNTFRTLTLDTLENCEIKLFESEEFKGWYQRWFDRRSRQSQSKEECYQLMKENNPSIIPRNHRVEEALEAAINGDHTVMDQLLSVLEEPYAYTKEQESYTTLPEPSKQPYQTYCGT
jgi:serine/tyrosine/threonine adenylyltransferase